VPRQATSAGAWRRLVESQSIEGTHYDVLGVEAGASAAELKRAYLRQARRLHPDAHASSTPRTRDKAAKAMAALTEAWQILRDPDRRSAYDRLLLEKAERATDVDGRARARARWQAARHQAVTPTQTRTAAPPRPRSSPGSIPAPKQARRPAIGPAAGFRPWLGSSGTITRSGDSRPRYSLAVDGARDLRPLADLLPDRLLALHAARARIGDEQLAHLAGHRGLRLLDLSDTVIGDPGVAHLATCTSLDTLLLWNTRVTDRGLELLAQIPTLRVLGLGGVRVTDSGLKALSRLTSLRVLQLFGTEVTGPGLAALDPCTALELVSLPRRVAPRWRRRLRRTHPSLTIT
jgi:curved DNA-binding protein CbpA